MTPAVVPVDQEQQKNPVQQNRKTYGNAVCRKVGHKFDSTGHCEDCGVERQPVVAPDP